MAAPNYPRNGNERGRPNHRKQKMAAQFHNSDFRRASNDWLYCIVFNKIDLKKDSLSLNVVEALRGRCASFMILTARVSEIFRGQTS